MDIQFSKELMEKFGETILKRKREWSFFESVWYAIDWRNKQLRNLQSWYKAHLDLFKKEYSTHSRIVSLLNSLNGLTNDEKAIACLRWVKNNMRYVRDIDSVWKVMEHWQTPKESFNLREGDCEDGSILLIALLNLAGIPDYQYEVECGYVDGFGYKGGHAYVKYHSNTNGLTYVLDWCLGYDPRSINSRPLFNDSKVYKKTWFSFNEEHSWKRIKDPREKFK